MEDVLVIDAGYCTFRAGRTCDFPTESDPRVVTPSVVEVADGSAGDQKRTIQIFDHDSAIQNWHAYEAVVSHILYEQLGWPSGDEGNLVTTENPFISRKDREDLTQMMFETFNVLGYYVLDTMAASLYAFGKIQGVTVDAGYTGINVGQVADGALQLTTVDRYPIAGKALEDHMNQLLLKRGIQLSEGNLRLSLEQCSSVAETQEAYDSMVATNSAGRTKFELPDGQVIDIGVEGHAVGELLVRPEAVFPPQHGKQVLGIVEATYACAMQQPDPAARKTFFNNIVLCGGCATMSNLQQRVMRDLRTLVPATASATILGAPKYMPEKTMNYDGFVGASIIGSIIGPAQMMAKADYEEMGPAGVHRKC